MARCYRDEGGKPDRQPEFTQLDLEMSFAGREEVLAVVEDLMAAAWPGGLELPIRRMTYKEAMDKYGVDKPDLRYGNTIQNLGELFRGCGFDVIEDMLGRDDFFIGGVFFDGDDLKHLKTAQSEVTTALSDQLSELKARGESVLLSPLHTLAGGEASCSLLRKCSEGTSSAVAAEVGPGRLGFLVACRREVALHLLGRLRTALASLAVTDLQDRSVGGWGREEEHMLSLQATL